MRRAPGAGRRQHAPNGSAARFNPAPPGPAPVRSLFVTGTDTGVGKTIVAAGLARAAAKSGRTVAVYKPFAAGGLDDVAVATGAPHNTAGPPPAGMPGADALPVHGAFEYAFDLPASPYTAARLERKSIDVGVVLDRISELRRGYQTVIVEGIGGAMTPILAGYFVADLIRDMVMPAVIVTTNRIGALNHSVMTALACRQRGAHAGGFVINRTDDGGYKRGVLRSDIEAVAGLPVLAEVEKARWGDAPGAEAARKRRDVGIGADAGRRAVARAVAAAALVEESGDLDGVVRAMRGARPAGRRGTGR